MFSSRFPLTQLLSIKVNLPSLSVSTKIFFPSQWFWCTNNAVLRTNHEKGSACESSDCGCTTIHVLRFKFGLVQLFIVMITTMEVCHRIILFCWLEAHLSRCDWSISCGTLIVRLYVRLENRLYSVEKNHADLQNYTLIRRHFLLVLQDGWIHLVIKLLPLFLRGCSDIAFSIRPVEIGVGCRMCCTLCDTAKCWVTDLLQTVSDVVDVELKLTPGIELGLHVIFDLWTLDKRVLVGTLGTG